MSEADEHDEQGCADPNCAGHGSGGPPADPREEAEQVMHYMDTVNAQIESFTRQSDMTQMALDDNVRAQQALSKLESVPEGNETLVPVGGGAFIKVRAGDGGTVMMSLGKGLVADLPADKALEMLTKREEALGDQQQKLTGGIEALRHQAASLQVRLEELAALVQPPNVAPMD